MSSVFPNAGMPSFFFCSVDTKQTNFNGPSSKVPAVRWCSPKAAASRCIFTYAPFTQSDEFSHEILLSACSICFAAHMQLTCSHSAADCITTHELPWTRTCSPAATVSQYPFQRPIGASHVHHVDAATDAGRREDVGHITAGAIMSIIVLSDINVGGHIQLPFHIAETG